MAIFCRRILQYLINENSKFLSRKQTKSHVQKLNNMHKEMTLSGEWEVVLINAFSRLGKVFHEKNFNGKSKPDIYFETFSNSNHNFLADITTISDKGLDRNNPFEALSDELYKKVEEYGLRENSFSLQVGSYGDHNYKDGHKVRLKLPGYARFSKVIFGENFEKFLKDIIRYPNIPFTYKINKHDTDVVISYNPNKKFASEGHPSYTGIHLLTENRVYEALEEKASQLRKTNFNGHIGIFLCDGGYSSFNNNPPAWLGYSAEEVIRAFLKKK